jgi:hypothetical protein
MRKSILITLVTLLCLSACQNKPSKEEVRNYTFQILDLYYSCKTSAESINHDFKTYGEIAMQNETLKLDSLSFIEFETKYLKFLSSLSNEIEQMKQIEPISNEHDFREDLIYYLTDLEDLYKNEGYDFMMIFKIGFYDSRETIIEFQTRLKAHKKLFKKLKASPNEFMHKYDFEDSEIYEIQEKYELQ